MRHYCTYFDAKYLARGLALYRSLQRHGDAFKLWVLCLDDTTYATLASLQLPEVSLITLAELEAADAALQRVKAYREVVEYYWTCTPVLTLFLLEHHPDMDVLSYVDADLFFFSSPEPVYTEMGASSIMIIEHRFAPKHSWLAPTRGIFNVGMVTFRNNDQARDCVRWWRDKCLEACGPGGDGGLLGDQQYLDEWPTRFPGVHLLQHLGAGVAPWNVSQYRLTLRNDEVYVDDSPLIFFHFHSLKVIDDDRFWLAGGEYDISPATMKLIYRPYLHELRNAALALASITGESLPSETRLTWREMVYGVRTGRMLFEPPRWFERA